MADVDNEMRVCTECKHHNGASRESNIWSHRCKHPDLRFQPDRCPVTGREGYMSNHGYLTELPYPNCKDLNPDGKCRYWELGRKFRSKRKFK